MSPSMSKITARMSRRVEVMLQVKPALLSLHVSVLVLYRYLRHGTSEDPVGLVAGAGRSDAIPAGAARALAARAHGAPVRERGGVDADDARHRRGAAAAARRGDSCRVHAALRGGVRGAARRAA